MSKGIVFIRNSDFKYDTRLRKAVNSALEAGYKCIVLEWLRDGEKVKSGEVQLAAGSVEVKSYIKEVPFGRGMINVFSGLTFLNWIKHVLVKLAGQYDLIYACDYDVGGTAYKVAKKLNKKFIYDIFDYYSETHAFPKLAKLIIKKGENKLINMADVVIICHESRYNQIKGATPKKCVVIHNTPAFDEAILNRNAIIQNRTDKFKVVYVGTLSEKGRLLGEILEQSKSHKNIEFHLAGSGQLQEYVQNLSKEDENIIYYGMLKNEDALKLTSECDVVFAVYQQNNLNNQYSAPNKVYEAMAMSKPIIVCCGKYIDSMIVENNTGIVINYCADEFYSAIDKLISDKKLSVLLADNAHELYNKQYSWKIMNDRLKNIYNMLLEKS